MQVGPEPFLPAQPDAQDRSIQTAHHIEKWQAGGEKILLAEGFSAPAGRLGVRVSNLKPFAGQSIIKMNLRSVEIIDTVPSNRITDILEFRYFISLFREINGHAVLKS